MEHRNNRENCLKQKIGYFTLGFVGAVILSTVFPVEGLEPSGQIVYSNSFHSLLFAILSGICFLGLKKRRFPEKRRDTAALLLSLMLSLFLVVGSNLEDLDNFNAANVGNYLKILGCGLYFTPMAAYLWQKIDEVKMNREGKNKGSHLLRNAGILFCCWLPVFLAFYPGAFVYDAWEEYVQAETGEYTTHHPLLHVLLLGKAVVFGKDLLKDPNLGIAIYTILQMIVFAFALANTLEYLRRKGMGKWEEGAGLLFYGFFPVIPMYAVCSAKDTLFSAFLLLTLVKILELSESKKSLFEDKKKAAGFVLSAALMMLFRKNGSYAYLVWAAVFLLFLFIKDRKKKQWMVQTGIFLFLPFFLFSLTETALEGITDAKAGGKQEIMTVPIQQMARVYNYAPQTYTEEEKQILYEILPKEELHIYTPRISDLLKSKFNNEVFRKDPFRYLSLWGKTGLKKPLIYLNAWWLTSYGYWYPDAVINVYGGTQRYTFQYGESSYFGFETEPPGERDSKLPFLEKFYKDISLELFQQRLPAVSMLFSPGFLFWCYSFFMGYYLWKKEWNKILPFSLILLVWLTVILGPTYLIRYVLILWLIAPLYIGLSFYKREEVKNKSQM